MPRLDRILLFAIPAMVALALAPLADACDTSFAVGSCSDVAALNDFVPERADTCTFYVAPDVGGCPTQCLNPLDCLDGCSIGIWAYQESNGESGLQRNDSQHDDACNGQTESDTLLV